MSHQEATPLSKKQLLRRSGWGALLICVAMFAIDAYAGWSPAYRIGTLFLILGAIWLVKSFFASDEPMRENQRRYLREVSPALLAYMVLVFAFKPLLGLASSDVVRALIALLPVLPIVFLVRAMVRKVLGGDELERRMQLEAISIASISVGLLSFAAGFMRMAGVFRIDNALLFVLPALLIAYGLAKWWVGRRYQGR